MKSSPWQNLRRDGKYFFDLIFSQRIRTNALQAVPFWLASLLTGLIGVAYTKLFAYSETILQTLLHWHGWMIFLMTPFCFFLAWLVVRVFAPNARGSGIPQVMAAIELSTPKHEKKVDQLLSLRIIAVKICSSLLMVLGGGAIGREGPTIQIAGSVFRIVNKWIPASWPKLAKQSFILTGAAAGLAAAFNTPLGGVVFAMEELARIHIRFFRTALFSAVIIAGLTAQGLLGPYLYLGYPDVGNLHFSIFLGVAVSAIAAGFLGALTSKGILAMMKWKSGFNRTRSVLFLLVSGLAIAAIAYFINDAILGSGKFIMNKVLFTDEKAVSWDTVGLRMLGSIICFNTGAAGGVFAPALAAGASTGAFIGHLFHIIGSNANILILSGMVGFLTGVTRTPFTSAILVLEMTDRHSVIFHLMLAALLSNFAALIVDKHSLYERLKKDYLKDVLEKESREEEEQDVPNGGFASESGE
ncbi:MAG: chloride channel protein [Flavisolibacter sp.]